jgi:hypothetical protein
MLLKVGTAMILFAVALAAVVTVAVGLSGPSEEESASQTASLEPLSAEATPKEKKEFNADEKLEIDREPTEKTSPEEPHPPPAPRPTPPRRRCPSPVETGPNLQGRKSRLRRPPATILLPVTRLCPLP